MAVDSALDGVISENIRVMLARYRWSAAKVARDIGMEPRAFRERTRNEVPWSAVELVAVARVLGVTVESLATEPPL